MSESKKPTSGSTEPGNTRDVAVSALAATGRQILPFVIGGASGIVGTTCVQPIDMVKVRLQLLGEGAAGKGQSPTAVARKIVAEDGFFSLYNGISAAWLRQASYATLRLGFFDRFLAYATTRAESQGRSVGFGERTVASLSAGGLAAALANPAEVALIRLQSDGMKPRDQRANYRSVVDALMRIAKAEGITALWSGAYPTIVRAMATNFGQLAFFSESKHQLKQHTSLSDRNITFAASGVAGFFASFLGLPFDFLKTRLQRGGSQYKGMLDCALQAYRKEGFLRFYRGFGTYFLRIAPHTIITLIVADNVTAYAKQSGIL
ncbi:Putative mitochondrial carrier protein [Septoria linicola]|uniref:Mitochondrial carrier protein n=1 Tax=Septoria linicola TaxID=215465 RepID=A0A9Q9AXR7_9PEZI|nr:putative mitochondrial carrier protein [Septoria linicola]USW57009.1 Putative mitochondrial carrier protein [Septoria linicola]